MAKRLAWRFRTIMAAALALAALALCLALPAQAHAMENPFKVEGENLSVGTDWSYDSTSDVLTVKTAKPLTISMDPAATSPTTAVIYVEVTSTSTLPDTYAHVTLKDVKIDCYGERSDLAPLYFGDKTYLVLKLEGDNVLTAGGGKAGLDASGPHDKGSSVFIEGDGSLTATGGPDGGAGIGSNVGEDMQSTITIYGGTVTAKGQNGGAGIGSASGRNINSTMYIHGGTVTATGSTTGAGVGGAGFGAGADGMIDGDISIDIRGGEVTAKGGAGAAGIGTGQKKNTGYASIGIYDGTIRVTPGSGSVGIGGGVNNSFYGEISIDNAYITVVGGSSSAFSEATFDTTIKSGCFGEGVLGTETDNGTVYGLSVHKDSKVVENEDDRRNEFPYCVARDATLVLTVNPDPSTDEYADQYPKEYDSKPYPATMKIPTETGFKDVGLLQQASYKDSNGYSDADKVLYRYHPYEEPDNWSEWASEENGGLPVDAGEWIIEAYLPDSPVEGNAHYYGVKKTSDKKTIKPLELSASGTPSLAATLPSVAVGTAKSENIEITLSGGNIYDRDNTADNPFKATATVTYPSTDATGDKTDATVKITALPDGCNYSLPADGIKLTNQKYTVEKKTPQLTDFDITLPEDAVYKGSEYKAVVAPKSTAAGMGVVTVHYTKDNVTSDDAPKDAGTYRVTFDVAEGTAYGATTAPLEAGSFTINKCTLDANVKAALPDVLVGTDATVADTQITLSDGNILADDAPLAATATVERPSTETADTYNDAKVSSIVLSDAAKANYTVSPGYTLSNQTYKVLDKKTPQLSDFDVELPTNVAYDGAAHAATASAASGVTGMGAVTVRYTKGDVTSTTAPVDAGTYQVTLDVAAGSSYEAGSVDADTFTIAQRELDGTETAALPSVATGTGETQNTPITLTGGAIVSGQTVTATATVTHPSSATANADPYADASVSKVVLTNAPNYVVPAGYALSNQSYRVSDKAVPTLGDFTVTSFSGEYDGIGHKAAIAPKDGVGAVQNVRYLKGGTAVDGEPTDAGSYTLVFDVAEGDAYIAESNLTVSDAVVITPRILDTASVAALDDVAQGTSEARNLTVTLSGGRILGGELSAVASTVSYPSAGTPGPHADATVTPSSLVNAPNYALPSAGLALAGQAYFVVSTAPVYAIVEGADGIWNGDSQTGLRFRADGDLDKFTEVRVDGVLLDAANYTAESGSTVITLAPAYLATLKAGEHTLLVEFTDGSAETTFTVKAASEPEQKPGGTGEGSGGNGAGTGDGGSAAKPLAPTGDPLALVLGGAGFAAVLAGGALALARRRG